MAEKREFKCKFCGMTFATEEELMKHTRERHAEEMRKEGMK